MKSRPAENEYAESFREYVARVPETDALAVLEGQTAELGRLTAGVAPGREKHRYAEGKWSIREVIGHLIDSERVFAYRAFCISRGEQVSLPGFDENVYVAASHYDARPLADLMSEFSALRKGNVLFFRSLGDAEWSVSGPRTRTPSRCGRWHLSLRVTCGTTSPCCTTATGSDLRHRGLSSRGLSLRGLSLRAELVIARSCHCERSEAIQTHFDNGDSIGEIR